jgi:hypothetical protein
VKRENLKASAVKRDRDRVVFSFASRGGASGSTARRELADT